MPDVPTDAPLSTQDDETYTNAITTVAGEVGFHIDAQTRVMLKEAFEAGEKYGRDDIMAPSFDEWLDGFIERKLDIPSQSEGH
jgi:hypothetical protein